MTGSKLDPERYLRDSSLEPCRVYQAGAPRRASKPDGAKNATSGFHVTVSEASWSDLAAQVADACAFLSRHADELRVLASLPAVEDLRLDFPVDQRLGTGHVAQFEYLPPELLKAAGTLGIGVEISIYPTSDDDENELRGV